MAVFFRIASSIWSNLQCQHAKHSHLCGKGLVGNALSDLKPFTALHGITWFHCETLCKHRIWQLHQRSLAHSHSSWNITCLHCVNWHKLHGPTKTDPVYIYIESNGTDTFFKTNTIIYNMISIWRSCAKVHTYFCKLHPYEPHGSLAHQSCPASAQALAKVALRSRSYAIMASCLGLTIQFSSASSQSFSTWVWEDAWHGYTAFAFCCIHRYIWKKYTCPCNTSCQTLTTSHWVYMHICYGVLLHKLSQETHLLAHRRLHSVQVPMPKWALCFHLGLREFFSGGWYPSRYAGSKTTPTPFAFQ